MTIINVTPLRPGSWIAKFDFNKFAKDQVKAIGGASWSAKGGGWRVPANLHTVERLNAMFDCHIVYHTRIRRWVARELDTASALRQLSQADTGIVPMLEELRPDIHDFISSRPYQMADIAFMAQAEHLMNCNDPGTGKTIETIGTIFEAGLDTGPILIVAPYTAVDATWGDVLRQWLPAHAVYTAGAAGPSRDAVLGHALALAARGGSVWLVVNPEALKPRLKKGETEKDNQYIDGHPRFFDIEWNAIVFDEFHKMGITNEKTLMYKTIKRLQTHKKIMLSGTPMGGQPIKLYFPLHFMYPDVFHSKWAFVNNWLTSKQEKFLVRGGHGQEGVSSSIGDVRADRREAFNTMMAQYMIRRTKAEVMPWLPLKQYEVRWARLTGAQHLQYEEWERNTEIEIDEHIVDAVSILAVYTRLRQFANAVQEVEVLPEDPETGEPRYRLRPKPISAKLDMLYDVLDELGVLDPNTTEKAIVFSQFTTMIDMVESWLGTKKVQVGVITGKVKGADRLRLVRKFQEDNNDLRIMLMNTQAGGVSITLDKADTVIFLDETWNPDDQTQAEDRAHRGTKTSQVRVIRILAKDTIEEKIFKGNITKNTINKRVLDKKRE